LPVELTLFSGKNDGDVNQLFWNTASELNTRRFVVQRSPDGLQFEDIGEVAANGNSRAPLEYTFTDDAPYSGDNLYRLRIEDHDGSSEYTKMIRLHVAGESGNKPTGIQNVYPNPTSGESTIQFFEGQDHASYLLRVYSMNGQVIHEEQLEFDRGLQTIPLQAASFAPGQYLLQFINRYTNTYHEVKFIRL
jgi:hypothetical protein